MTTCPRCEDTGMADSGGSYPWGEPILIPCDCREPVCDACNGAGLEQVAMGHGNIDVIDCSVCDGKGVRNVD
jgi:hypothetical protein